MYPYVHPELAFLLNCKNNCLLWYDPQLHTMFFARMVKKISSIKYLTLYFIISYTRIIKFKGGDKGV